MNQLPTTYTCKDCGADMPQEQERCDLCAEAREKWLTRISENTTSTLKDILEQSNKCTGLNLSFFGDDDFYWLINKDEYILDLPKEVIDESGMNPIKFFITTLYESERGKSKKKSNIIKTKLTKLYSKILNTDNDIDILELVEQGKILNEELKYLETDINWTKKIAHGLYQIKDGLDNLEYDYFIELLD